MEYLSIHKKSIFISTSTLNKKNKFYGSIKNKFIISFSHYFLLNYIDSVYIPSTSYIYQEN